MNAIINFDPDSPMNSTIFTFFVPVKVHSPLLLLFLSLDNVIEVERLLGVYNRCRCRAFLRILDLTSLENKLPSLVY